MVTINKDIFLEQSADRKILENVSKFCSRCYSEFNETDFIYYDVENIRYLCSNCACCISEVRDSTRVPNGVRRRGRNAILVISVVVNHLFSIS